MRASRKQKQLITRPQRCNCFIFVAALLEWQRQRNTIFAAGSKIPAEYFDRCVAAAGLGKCPAWCCWLVCLHTANLATPPWPVLHTTALPDLYGLLRRYYWQMLLLSGLYWTNRFKYFVIVHCVFCRIKQTGVLWRHVKEVLKKRILIENHVTCSACKVGNSFRVAFGINVIESSVPVVHVCIEVHLIWQQGRRYF